MLDRQCKEVELLNCTLLLARYAPAGIRIGVSTPGNCGIENVTRKALQVLDFG